VVKRLELQGKRGRTYTNDSLAYHDTNNLEVCHSGDPVVSAGSRFLAPTIRPDSLEKRFKVTDREEDVSLETKTGTRNDSMTKVPGQRRQRVFLEH